MGQKSNQERFNCNNRICSEILHVLHQTLTEFLGFMQSWAVVTCHNFRSTIRQTENSCMIMIFMGHERLLVKNQDAMVENPWFQPLFVLILIVLAVVETAGNFSYAAGRMRGQTMLLVSTNKIRMLLNLLRHCHYFLMPVVSNTIMWRPLD